MALKARRFPTSVITQVTRPDTNMAWHPKRGFVKTAILLRDGLMEFHAGIGEETLKPNPLVLGFQVQGLNGTRLSR